MGKKIIPTFFLIINKKTMKFSLKKLFDTNRLLTAICGVLLIVNITGFVYLSTVTPFSVPFLIVSNLITIGLMLMVFKPVNQIIKEAVDKEKQEEQLREEKLLKEKSDLKQQNDNLSSKILELNDEKEKLKSELDSVKQYNSLENSQRLTLKLETMEYEKEGYIVKEEIVRHTNYGEEITKSNPWLLDFADKGEQKVFFTKKYHEKALIGIDLTKVRYCRKNDFIYLEGVKFENLHNEMTLRRNVDEDINRCYVLNCKEDKTTINNDSKYNDFKKWYIENQNSIFQVNFNAEVMDICNKYTDVLRQTLLNRYPQVCFVDGKLENCIGLENLQTEFLEAGNQNDLIKISNSMMMISAAIQETMPNVNNP